MTMNEKQRASLIEREILKIQSQIASLRVDENILMAENEALKQQIQKYEHQQRKRQISKRKQQDQTEQLSKIQLKKRRIFEQKEKKMNQIEDKHMKNMHFLSSKLKNHQQTLIKYKQFYKSISISKVDTARVSQFETSKNSLEDLGNSFISSKNTQSNLQVSKFSTKQEQISVICELQCQKCLKTFKPKGYYQHLSQCSKQNVDNSNNKTQKRKKLNLSSIVQKKSLRIGYTTDDSMKVQDSFERV